MKNKKVLVDGFSNRLIGKIVRSLKEEFTRKIIMFVLLKHFLMMQNENYQLDYLIQSIKHVWHDFQSPLNCVVNFKQFTLSTCLNSTDSLMESNLHVFLFNYSLSSDVTYSISPPNLYWIRIKQIDFRTCMLHYMKSERLKDMLDATFLLLLRQSPVVCALCFANGLAST